MTDPIKWILTVYVSVTAVTFINTSLEVMSYLLSPTLEGVFLAAILELPVLFTPDSRRSSTTCVRRYWPSSWFMVVPPFFRISTASLIHLLCLSCSVPMTFASFQPITWLVSTTWSVMADLCTVDCDALRLARVLTVLLTFSASVLCSSRRVPNFLPVSPTYSPILRSTKFWTSSNVDYKTRIFSKNTTRMKDKT